jgi:acyl carrier protein
MTISREELVGELMAAVGSLALSDQPIEEGTTLEALGIDLPDLVELADEAHRRWQVEISADDLDGADTVGELVSRIVARAQS